MSYVPSRTLKTDNSEELFPGLSEPPPPEEEKADAQLVVKARPLLAAVVPEAAGPERGLRHHQQQQQQLHVILALSPEKGRCELRSRELLLNRTLLRFVCRQDG